MPQTTARHPRRSLPEVLPLVSPCPKAPYATGRSPSVLTYGPDAPGEQRIPHCVGRHDVPVDISMDPKSMNGKIGHDRGHRGRVAKTSFVFSHRSAREGMRADDRVGTFAQHQRPQIIGGELMRPGAKAPYFRGALGAIVDIPVHLGNGLDHPQIAVGDDARDDERGILVRIHHTRLCRWVEPAQLTGDRVCSRNVADADAGGEEQDAN